jgi:RHS repeat-associated protein
LLSSQTITYHYDSLYRLIDASYSTGTVFTYTYDAVGNRATQQTLTQTTVYTYDNANRLTNVNGVAQIWDDNGNLVNDGASTYAYDSANRLITVTQGANVYIFAYNGQGDRVRQTTNSTVTTYTLDLNAGLTQVLADGANTYLYGTMRIGELQSGGFAYHLPDALGSVRQLTDANASVTLAKSYEPFGAVLTSAGNGTSIFGWAGEARDASGLVFLRARYYSVTTGRFFVRDSWPGNVQMPGTLHPYLYGMNNPTMYTDPTGHEPWWCEGRADEDQCVKQHLKTATSQQKLSDEQLKFIVRTLGAFLRGQETATQAQVALGRFAFGVMFQFFDDESFGFTSKTNPRSAAEKDPPFVLGRIAGRGASLGLGAAEIGFGGGCALGGLLTVEAGGVGVIPLTGGIALVGHGGAVIIRDLVTPVPNIYFAQATEGGSEDGGSKGSSEGPLDNWKPGDPLPNAEYAQVDPAKFRDYSMNPNNPGNDGKWEAFESLGYDVSTDTGRARGAQDVIRQLFSQIRSAPASMGKVSTYGPRLEVDMFLRGPNGKMGTLKTSWQYDSGGDIPRLITNWLAVHR